MQQKRIQGTALVLPLAMLALAACGGEQAGQGAGADTTALMTDTVAPTATTATATATPDAQFLMQMSDHHQGLIQMAEAAHQKSDITVHDLATRLSQQQQQEQQQMLQMLQTSFQQQHTPSVMPQNQAMLDSLQAQSGPAYDRAFRQAVIRHHQEGIAMIDQYLPQFTNPQVRQRAEQMRAQQQREIQELQAQLGQG